MNNRGRYNGPTDLSRFKGIIHLPYTWSSLAFFENIQLGLPYFFPSPEFFLKLYNQGNYFIPNPHFVVDLKRFDLLEWYCKEHQEIVTYFDSWDDLIKKLHEYDFEKGREKIRAFAKKHQEKTLSQWKQVFDAIQNKKYLLNLCS